MDLLTKRFSVLAALQAAMGAVIVATTGLVYVMLPGSLNQASLTMAMAGCGAVVVLYYLSLHQFLKRKHLKGSTVVLSLLSSLNIMLVILATGGLDSPYYALWLLAIVVAGFFGSLATLLVVLATAAFFGVDIWMHGLARDYITAHLGELFMAAATGAIAEWIHVSLGRNNLQHAQVAQLNGKLTEESLKSEVLMQSVGEGVLVVNTQRQIKLFNPSAVKVTGWDVKSALGIDYRLVLNLRDASGNKFDDTNDPFSLMWKSKKNLVRSDITMETKGGRKIAVNLSLSPIYDQNNQVSGGIALFRDISAEKEVERQRDEFISTASHEMRTPVAAVEGYLSLAMNPAVATVDDRAKQYLEKAHASTQHLGQLFRDLLSVTKMEDNRLSPDEVFDVTALVKDAVSDMKFEANKKGLELQFGAEDQRIRGENSLLPVYAVRANPQRLREVVTNLIENAIKFTTSGTIRVTIGGSNDTTTVSVADSGIGISAEDIGHLFQKFYRIDSTATRTIGGTGLGLYLCRSIIERAGGRIWVESELGHGSNFKFSLPRQASDKIGKVSSQATPTAQPTAATPTTSPAAANPTPTPIPSPALPPASAPVMAASTPVATTTPAAAAAPTAAPAYPVPAPAPITADEPAAPMPLPGSIINPATESSQRMMTDIKKPVIAAAA